MSTSEPLPKIEPHIVEAVVAWLLSCHNWRHRPEASARVMVLAVKLHQTRTSWPTRRAVAEHLDLPTPLVEATVLQHCFDRFLVPVAKTGSKYSDPMQPSGRPVSFLEPCAAAIAVVEDSEL